MRCALVLFVVIAGCGSSDQRVDGPGVTDVAVAPETAAPATAEPNAEHEAPATPRRAAVERTVPTEVPPEPSTSRSDLETARELFKQGVEAFDKGDLPRAESIFTKVYALAPRPQVLFNLGRVLLAEGKTKEACAAYEKYWLTLSPPDPSKRAQLPMAQCPNLATLP